MSRGKRDVLKDIYGDSAELMRKFYATHSPKISDMTLEALKQATKTGWERLEAIENILEKGEELPLFYAQWLIYSIKFASRNEELLLENLGIKKTRGNPNRMIYKRETRFRWGGFITELRLEGVSSEESINIARENYADINQLHDYEDSLPDRETFNRWARDYESKLRQLINMKRKKNLSLKDELDLHKAFTAQSLGIKHIIKR